MGVLRKLFGQKDSKQNLDNLTKISEMLDEDLYWKIVQESRENTNNQDDQEKFLIKKLKKLNSNEIIGFRLRTDKLLYDTYNSEMWCAGYILNGGCSDDSFEYFRNWVISRGKKVYYEAKNNPDSLINEIDEELDFYDFESFWYVALDAFEQKTGKQLYDFIDEDNFNFNEGSYPHFDFTWQEENPDSMKAICPMLFDKFWK